MLATMGKKERSEVTLSVFGDRRYTTRWPGTDLAVADVLSEHGVDVGGRRLAKNGHRADLTTVVTAGDELTLVPRVQGG